MVSADRVKTSSLIHHWETERVKLLERDFMNLHYVTRLKEKSTITVVDLTVFVFRFFNFRLLDFALYLRKRPSWWMGWQWTWAVNYSVVYSLASVSCSDSECVFSFPNLIEEFVALWVRSRDKFHPYKGFSHWKKNTNQHKNWGRK